MALEAESVAVNVDATPREGETSEVVQEQELEKESKNRRKECKKRRRRVSLCRKSLDWRQRVPRRQSPIILIQPLSSSQPTPVLIYSTTTTTSVPPNLIPISDAMREILRYALNLGTDPVSSPQQAMVQITISVQAPISSPVLNPSPTFDVHLNVADLEFLQKKLGENKGKLGSALGREPLC